MGAPFQGKTKKEDRTKLKGFDEEKFTETKYYEENGLQKVQPYYFTFTSYAKGRWIGSTIYDVFCKEFRSETPQYYEKAIKVGRVTVNGKTVGLDAVVCNNDVICHKVHRHEPPVTATSIKILESNDDILVVNKPSSIPVHPCGRYRHNTVVFQLGREYGFKNLHTLHRIDRLTSGVLMFAKSATVARKFETEIREREVIKEYVCRVQGEFPSDCVECTEPIVIVSHKIGVCRVSPDGKACRTTFYRMGYDGETSVVKCVPYTGRMHQIRVHLQWLGFPIVNDPLYNHSAWGPTRGKKGEGIESIDTIISKLLVAEFGNDEGNSQLRAVRCSFQPLVATDTDKVAEQLPFQGAPPDTQEETGGKQIRKQSESESSCGLCDSHQGAGDMRTGNGYEIDADCTECSLSRPDPQPQDLMMYLHALRYKGPGWEYFTDMPDWARDDWKNCKETNEETKG
ncbi:pseudouridylate synthase RPUSD2-like isoform X2 [Corticium candelabrum]|uniref:pseudouridylate synthase RPUSD2-like isoform X2 n=1 Tax=Corticium candelabrum TaxID=121492 RepID=UPI002E26654F|nr:pseudouridylate synthase RPUSD2-like isoform X2 [Corticium candelabrum]